MACVFFWFCVLEVKCQLVRCFFLWFAGLLFFLANFRWRFHHFLEKRHVNEGQNEDWSNENSNIHCKKHISCGSVTYWRVTSKSNSTFIFLRASLTQPSAKCVFPSKSWTCFITATLFSFCWAVLQSKLFCMTQGFEKPRYKNLMTFNHSFV